MTYGCAVELHVTPVSTIIMLGHSINLWDLRKVIFLHETISASTLINMNSTLFNTDYLLIVFGFVSPPMVLYPLGLLETLFSS